MKKLLLTVFLSFYAFFAICQTLIKGKVVRISDGDTITILTVENKQVRIRLYGIDCPENGQDFATVAKQYTADRCFGNWVTIEVKNTDRYGRTVGNVILANSTVLNKALLQAGLAWHSKQYDKSKELSALEYTARKNKIGIWSHKKPIEPWLYRKEKAKRGKQKQMLKS